MNFYNVQHKYYCGVDLHAKSMFLCVLDREGKKVLHRNIRTDREYFLKTLEPYREDIVVGAECMFSWYWVADLCAEQKIPFVLGHALYMKAIHGGKAKNDKIDSHKIAVILRGGMFPTAYVYPKEMRATRDLMRRRTHFVRKRAELLAHVQLTRLQYNLPEFEKKLAKRKNRAGFAAAYFDDPCVQQSVKADVETIEYLHDQINTLTLSVLRSARIHDPEALRILQTIHGVAQVLALTILYEVQDIRRFPRVQEFLSYSRLVKSAKESAGKRLGSGGSKIGNAHLKWAFSEASVCFLSNNEAGRAYFEKLVRKHGKPKALTLLAAKLGRAVYVMLAKKRSFDMTRFLQH